MGRDLRYLQQDANSLDLMRCPRKQLLVLLSGLLASCQSSSSEPLDIDYRLDNNPVDQVRKPQPATVCSLDTAAILTNAKLDDLLKQISRQELKEYNTVKHIPKSILSYLDCLASGNFSIVDARFIGLDTDGDDSSDRRLKYLGVGKTITLITYEAGSTCFTSSKAIIIRSNNDVVQDIWLGSANYHTMSKSTIINSIYTDQHQAAVLKQIEKTRKYILDKHNKTISDAAKRNFIRSAFQYQLAI